MIKKIGENMNSRGQKRKAKKKQEACKKDSRHSQWGEPEGTSMKRVYPPVKGHLWGTERCKGKEYNCSPGTKNRGGETPVELSGKKQVNSKKKREKKIKGYRKERYRSKKKGGAKHFRQRHRGAKSRGKIGKSKFSRTRTP